MFSKMCKIVYAGRSPGGVLLTFVEAQIFTKVKITFHPLTHDRMLKQQSLQTWENYLVEIVTYHL